MNRLNNHKKRIFLLPEEIHDALVVEAESRHTTVTAVVKEILVRWKRRKDANAEDRPVLAG